MAQQVLTGGISTERYPNWDSKGRIYYTDENGNVIPDTSSFVDKLVNTGRKLKATAHNIGNWINETNPDSEAYKQKANLVLGLETAPFGMSATATKALGAKLAPVLGNKIAQMTAQGLGGGLVSGGVEGFGRGLIEGENPFKTALTDAGIGTVAGGLGGLALGNAGKYLARKGALRNPNNAGAYIDDYVSGKTIPNKADLRDYRSYKFGGELASGKPEIAYDLAPDYDTNLKKWFGNSKVVDENGNPLVVYHGTNADFDTFKNKLISSNSGNYGHGGLGFYFSVSPKEAMLYGNNLGKYYLKMNKPFVPTRENLIKYADVFELEKNVDKLDKEKFFNLLKEKDAKAYNLAQEINQNGYTKGWDNFLKTNNAEDNIYDLNLIGDWLDNADNLGEYRVNEIKTLFDNAPIRRDYGYISSLPYLLETGTNKELAEEFTNRLIKDGYDGVINGSEYTVFNPTQIKSVNNQGTFDPTNPNIYKSILGVLGTGEMLRRLQPQSRFQEELLQ